MAALKQGRLDCVILDRAEYLTAYGGAIWERLIELLEDGTLLSLGVAVRTPSEAHAALDNRDVCHLELPFNVLDWRWQASGVIDRIRARSGVTVHARNILLHGLLATGEAAKWPIDGEIDQGKIMDDLRSLAQRLRRASVTDLCVAYVRGQDWIDGTMLLTGGSERDLELRLSLKPPLSPDGCATVARTIPHIPARFLEEHSRERV